MKKVKITQKSYDFDAEDTIEGEVKPYGDGGAHITVPKKWLGYKIIVVIKQKIKQWTGGYVKKGYKGLSAKELSKEIEKGLQND